MENPQFSIVVLAFNEAMHLPRLLDSIKGLNTKVYVCDSGSTDGTQEIIQAFGAEMVSHPFVTHPRQWDFALNHFEIDTPWVIGLDSDHIVLPELYERLKHFSDDQVPPNISGIYFNRKNYFKGRWIKHGGYFPKYLMKMFRHGVGYSDLNENMDHRFVLQSGGTMVWADAYLKEENLKENKISFWIEKHNRYSDLTAAEEVERKRALRSQVIKPRFFGSPDERIAYLKKVWWGLPLFLRPFLYFFYRYFIQLGILDGKEGLVFHFLQALWFRFVVDVKIWEIEKQAADPQE